MCPSTDAPTVKEALEPAAVMSSIRVSVHLPASPEKVWQDVRDISSHVEWMSDAESIAFRGDAREGVGVLFDCITKVGPVRLTDRMEITEWTYAEAMGISHQGVVQGTGTFRLIADGNGTEFVWEETLRFPWWLAGPLGARIGRVVLRRIWTRNLRNLAARFA